MQTLRSVRENLHRCIRWGRHQTLPRSQDSQENKHLGELDRIYFSILMLCFTFVFSFSNPGMGLKNGYEKKERNDLFHIFFSLSIMFCFSKTACIFIHSASCFFVVCIAWCFTFVDLQEAFFSQSQEYRYFWLKYKLWYS